jgi:hypothetical protein
MGIDLTNLDYQQFKEGLDHGVGHVWSRSMTAKHSSVAFFVPSTIIARFQHISYVCHRWQGGDMGY